MTSTTPRARSKRLLALFLVAAVAPPVVLALGPFRKHFFPQDVAALRALAIVEPPKLEGLALDDELRAICERELARGNAAALFERLESLPRERVTPAVAYVHGMAALLAQRPAVAVAGLESAREGAAAAGDARLAREATFALAQADLLLDRGSSARARLSELSSSPGARRDEAAAQLARLESTSRRLPAR
jgi:hypothetical protein